MLTDDGAVKVKVGGGIREAVQKTSCIPTSVETITRLVFLSK